MNVADLLRRSRFLGLPDPSLISVDPPYRAGPDQRSDPDRNRARAASDIRRVLRPREIPGKELPVRGPGPQESE